MDATPSSNEQLSRYISFTRQSWEKLRDNMPLTLSETRLRALQGLNEHVSLQETTQIYLPLSRLLSLYVAATQNLHKATDTFLETTSARVPYIIGIAGSVAVGKSTTARLLQALLAEWPSHPRVDLVTTDGFLYPKHTLEARGLMSRKGFPESYDLRHLLQFLIEVKSGRPTVTAPVYSHLTYDIVANEVQYIQQPDILIIEGLNVLQTSRMRSGKTARLFVSDFFDFSIYVDAEEKDIERWYIERFLTLRETAFRNPTSYFHRHASLSIEGAIEVARGLWQQINAPNLRENIQPTRERAHLILKKGPDHRVQEVRLRKL
ncbi:type I pantothenate kinase [Ktedonosporobacter rubrisoli]|uniref:Pantothenate kinase n=1 Tax=Ktedonosporobacter rubrisoli TaxID=2509675 RepID=A0A4P6JR95_KTERU|nr:type I pantothenate kinase [Ktedonosporobacter rubrisoli]QBD77720.1 type I pantothenate kinase [Ktedonosporobacter rubrisoli]